MVQGLTGFCTMASTSRWTARWNPGSLQWLAGQCRFDLAFDISTLQGEVPPTVGPLLRANKVIKEAQATQNFKLRFHPIDFVKGGVMSITDAALGNVDSRGSTEVDRGQAGEGSQSELLRHCLGG